MNFWPPAPAPPWQLKPLLVNDGSNPAYSRWSTLVLALTAIAAIGLILYLWHKRHQQRSADPDQLHEAQIRAQLLHLIGPQARWLSSHELARLIPTLNTTDQPALLVIQQSLAQLEQRRFASGNSSPAAIDQPIQPTL